MELRVKQPIIANNMDSDLGSSNWIWLDGVFFRDRV